MWYPPALLSPSDSLVNEFECRMEPMMPELVFLSEKENVNNVIKTIFKYFLNKFRVRCILV